MYMYIIKQLMLETSPNIRNYNEPRHLLLDAAKALTAIAELDFVLAFAWSNNSCLGSNNS